MTRNEWRERMLGILAKRTGEALELQSYKPDRRRLYRVGVLIERGGLSTAKYGNGWLYAAELDAFLRGAVAATTPREETAGLF